VIGWETEPSDRAALIASVREARRQADFVLFAIHAHETSGDEDDGPANFQPAVLHFANEAAGANDPRPADFLLPLFHAAIDAGADAVVRTGPHAIGGIEIYKGRPIYYGLGSLFFDFSGRRSLTTASGETFRFPDEWFETVVPIARFQRGQVMEIRLHPFALASIAGPESGLPRPAGADQARRILARLQSLSVPYGTQIRIENGIGIIRVAPDPPAIRRRQRAAPPPTRRPSRTITQIAGAHA
jgi:hypothetical protein